MVDIANVTGGFGLVEAALEAFLALGEGKGAQIFAACEQQIEDEEDQILRPPIGQWAAGKAAKLGAPLSSRGRSCHR